MKNKVRNMVYAALLTALAIIIPIQFGFLKVVIPPFSATLASHVPMFIAMFVSPGVAAAVGVGSGVGFLLSGMAPVVVARALMHIIVGYVGARIIDKEQKYWKSAIITGPLHGLLEALVVIPFIGFDLYQLIVVTGVCTVIHHGIDAVMSYAIVRAMAAGMRKNIYELFGKKVEETYIEGTVNS